MEVLSCRHKLLFLFHRPLIYQKVKVIQVVKVVRIGHQSIVVDKVKRIHQSNFDRINADFVLYWDGNGNSELVELEVRG